MKLYLAGASKRIEELRECRKSVVQLGHQVTSTWLEEKEGERDEFRALRDLQDIRAADLIVSLTSPGIGKGGRHVEFGVALALEKHQAIVGPREHVFHYLSCVSQFDDTESFLTWLEQQPTI